VKYLGIVLFLLAVACQSFREQPALTTLEDMAPVVSPFVDTALYNQTTLSSRESVRYFYKERNYSLAWRDSSPAADSLIEIISRAHTFGFIGENYHLADIQRYLNDTISHDAVSRMDLLLTDAYLTLHRHLRQGRLDPRTLRRRNLAATIDKQAITSLQKLSDVSLGNELRSLEPQVAAYHHLKTALKAFVLLGQNDSSQQERAIRISLNMERWRWQKLWPDRYVVVNIPASVMRVVENDSVWLESKVIVGKRETPTPVMESVIRSFIIYPYWHVPFSISTKEILPLLQANASYLERNNFDVLNKKSTQIIADTIQWDRYDAGHFPFILRQREGSENSMGIIKFNFANNYGVFLHDTNSKRLYKRARRDLSHGCVRVDKAVALAHYLVREDDIYVSPEDLDQYLSLQQRLKIDLRKPITLKLEYFTAEVHGGVPLFYEDIYKKDSVMLQSLYQPEVTFLTRIDSTSF
jgi:murein L,D-transpeptidase YcbB/YkuD